MRKRGFGRRAPAGLSLLVLVAAVAVVVVSFGAGSALASGSYACTDNAVADMAALQPLIDGGGTVTITGTCLGNYTVSVSDVTIQGGAPGATLDGNGTGSVLIVTGGWTVTLRNLTVTGGNTNFGCPAACGGPDGDDGGGVSVDASTLNVVASHVGGNVSSDEGGGIIGFDDAIVNVTN
jgi:hypothetical protein